VQHVRGWSIVLAVSFQRTLGSGRTASPSSSPARWRSGRSS